MLRISVIVLRWIELLQVSRADVVRGLSVDTPATRTRTRRSMQGEGMALFHAQFNP